MKRFPVAALVTGLSTLVVCVGLAGSSAPSQTAPPAVRPPAPRPAATAPAPQAAHVSATAFDTANDTVKTFCVGCHNDKVKRGELSLASFDVAKAGEHAEIAEKVVRKLRTGLMPPREAARKPDATTRMALVTALETTLDAGAAARP